MESLRGEATTQQLLRKTGNGIDLREYVKTFVNERVSENLRRKPRRRNQRRRLKNSHDRSRLVRHRRGDFAPELEEQQATMFNQWVETHAADCHQDAKKKKAMKDKKPKIKMMRLTVLAICELEKRFPSVSRSDRAASIGYSLASYYGVLEKWNKLETAGVDSIIPVQVVADEVGLEVAGVHRRMAVLVGTHGSMVGAVREVVHGAVGVTTVGVSRK
ncbi:hypothetical protein DVH05_004994 [Phytophthora capsici]|nr:hypothetical protein DVH05_004994 [Phytophthora capsici]